MGRSLLAAAALSCGLVLAGPAAAAFPGKDGRIGFSRSSGPGLDYDIHTMRPNGTGKRAVVASRFGEFEPAFSPGGRRLVFTRDVDDRVARANTEIFLANLVTSDVDRLTASPANDWNPAFSASGGLVAFSSDRGPGPEYDIFVLNLATSTLTRIERPGDDFAPAFSPDGSKIVWSGYRRNGRADIFSEAIGGGERQNLTSTRRKSEEEPNVHPASTHLVYQRWGVGNDADPEIVLRSLSTGATRVLTHNGRQDLRPVFSPSRRWIAWERSRDGTDTSGRIWTMRIGGSDKRVRTPRRFDADSPDWQPRPPSTGQPSSPP